MKRMLPLLMICAVVLSLPAMASEGGELPEPPPESEAVITETVEAPADKPITINVNVPASAPESVETPPPVAYDAPELSGEPPAPTILPYKVYSLDDPASGMAELLTSDGEAAAKLPALLQELFGEYTPRTQTVTEYLSDGTSVTYQEYVPGVAGMDIPWLAAVGLFGLFCFCVLKLIGGVIKL